jgi:hypothetical protein
MLADEGIMEIQILFSTGMGFGRQPGAWHLAPYRRRIRRRGQIDVDLALDSTRDPDRYPLFFDTLT